MPTFAAVDVDGYSNKFQRILGLKIHVISIIVSARKTHHIFRRTNKKHLTGNAYYAAKKQAAALSQGAN